MTPRTRYQDAARAMKQSIHFCVPTRIARFAAPAIVCPAALPVRADFGALGLWSLLSVRAVIDPVAFLAGLAGIGPAPAKAGIVGLGRRTRVRVFHVSITLR